MVSVRVTYEKKRCFFVLGLAEKFWLNLNCRVFLENVCETNYFVYFVRGAMF